MPRFMLIQFVQMATFRPIVCLLVHSYSQYTYYFSHLPLSGSRSPSTRDQAARSAKRTPNAEWTEKCWNAKEFFAPNLDSSNTLFLFHQYMHEAQTQTHTQTLPCGCYSWNGFANRCFIAYYFASMYARKQSHTTRHTVRRSSTAIRMGVRVVQKIAFFFPLFQCERCKLSANSNCQPLTWSPHEKPCTWTIEWISQWNISQYTSPFFSCM